MTGHSDCDRFLYPALLGERWHSLHPTVRHAHYLGRDVHLRGTLTITHGRGMFARFLARRARFARKTGTFPAELVIRANDEGEAWQRTVGGQSFNSVQRRHDDDLLESFGRIEFRITMTERDRGIAYESRRAVIRLFGLAIPLPRFLAPRVRAEESVADYSRHTSIRVTVSAPLIGTIFSYDGRLLRTGETP